MGTYVNPGFQNLAYDRSDEFYVDKSMLIPILNERINSRNRFLCVSRPRRFGKTMAANMIAAYYSKGCDSHEVFSGLNVTKDPSFESNINKYNVIQLDMNDIMTNRGSGTACAFINKRVVGELKEIYPFVNMDYSLGIALQDIFKFTGHRFVIIIDEYDVIIRDKRYSGERDEYLDMLVSVFKSSLTSQAIALAYMTGIMPIIREKTESKLNNFTEYTMLDADVMAPFVGFTEKDAEMLAEKGGIDFSEIKRWYDGYIVNGIEIYSPKSVITAVSRQQCDDYWTQTGSYNILRDYILLDMDGIRRDVISMIGGARVPVNIRKFNNTPWEIHSRDDVFTYLIHLGYLSYDKSEKVCFIPNSELMSEWVSVVEDAPDYNSLLTCIRDSKMLLEATWNMDEASVAEGVRKAHMELDSLLQYNNDATFQCVIRLAYFYAGAYYTIVSELPSGDGFADIALIPYKPDIPAIIIELKKDRSADSALEQIRKRQYPKALEKYKGNLLMVGISYGSKTKEHFCRIEKAPV